MNREDYMDPCCPLKGKPGETEPRETVPVSRVIDRLKQYEDANDPGGAERHLKYWLAEAEQLGDRRAQLTLHNEMMGFYRMRGDGDQASAHAEQALTLLKALDMEDTVTAGTVRVNAATVREAFGDAEGALRLFREARDVYERRLEPGDGRLGGLYNNMGLALTALGAYEEAEDLFQLALKTMAKQEYGALEQAITWLNLADAAEARYGPEEAEPRIRECLEQAQALLDTEELPRNGYYAFVCEKCAPVFGRYGYFLEEAELRGRVKAIREGT